MKKTVIFGRLATVYSNLKVKFFESVADKGRACDDINFLKTEVHFFKT